MRFPSPQSADQAQLARDAHWCLTSPPLIKASEQGFPGEDWYQGLRINGADPTWPAPDDWSRFRLGIQFERLWHCAIDALADHTLVAHNLQVHDGGRTLGEFDALVQHRGQLEHWEFAVKFYLGTNDLTAPYHWFGPNPHDRLDLKLNHMQQHQMQLGSTPAGHQSAFACTARGIDSIRGIMKGRLFYPLLPEAEFGETSPSACPDCIHPDHLQGWWLPIETFSSRFSGQSLRFRTLEKRHWLATLAPSDRSDCLTADECVEKLIHEDEQYAHAIAVIDFAGNELSRGFLVKPAWLAAVTQDQSTAESFESSPTD